MVQEQDKRPQQVADAIGVLSSLAQGRDPRDGVSFPKDSPYNRPEVIRALFIALEHLKSAQSGGASRDLSHRHSSRRWTTQQDDELRERYMAGAALPELMQTMERGRGALINRLKILGLIDDADHVRD